jgi:hypothetical protein
MASEVEDTEDTASVDATMNMAANVKATDGMDSELSAALTKACVPNDIVSRVANFAILQLRSEPTAGRQMMQPFPEIQYGVCHVTRCEVVLLVEVK